MPWRPSGAEVDFVPRTTERGIYAQMASIRLTSTMNSYAQDQVCVLVWETNVTELGAALFTCAQNSHSTSSSLSMHIFRRQKTGARFNPNKPSAATNQ